MRFSLVAALFAVSVIAGGSHPADSTVTSTAVATVTSCPPEVDDCPATRIPQPSGKPEPPVDSPKPHPPKPSKPSSPEECPAQETVTVTVTAPGCGVESPRPSAPPSGTPSGPRPSGSAPPATSAPPKTSSPPKFTGAANHVTGGAFVAGLGAFAAFFL